MKNTFFSCNLTVESLWVFLEKCHLEGAGGGKGVSKVPKKCYLNGLVTYLSAREPRFNSFWQGSIWNGELWPFDIIHFKIAQTLLLFLILYPFWILHLLLKTSQPFVHFLYNQHIVLRMNAGDDSSDNKLTMLRPWWSLYNMWIITSYHLLDNNSTFFGKWKATDMSQNGNSTAII